MIQARLPVKWIAVIVTTVLSLPQLAFDDHKDGVSALCNAGPKGSASEGRFVSQDSEATAFDENDADALEYAGTGADTCDQAQVIPIAVGPVGSPTVITIVGDAGSATGPECYSTVAVAWWEAFQIDQCANVSIDFCNTKKIYRLQRSDRLAASCGTANTSCAPIFRADLLSSDGCNVPEAEVRIPSPWMRFDAVPAGTYYFPIVPNPSIAGSTPYRIRITVEACEGPCAGCRGACCLSDYRRCTDDVLQSECAAAGATWLMRDSCAAIECRPEGSGFDAMGVELLAHMGLSQFPSASDNANDIWGYVSPAGREYAIMGLSHGTGFVDVSVPQTPILIADIVDAPSLWSDIAVYDHYAYNVNENSQGGGMQIFDLEKIDEGVVALIGTFSESGFTRAHNVFVNRQSGYLYLCGANAPTSGLVAVDLADPASPTIVGVWEDAYAHDVYVTSYDDCPYSGRAGPCEIAFVFAGGQGLQVVDVTVKSQMAIIANLVYPNLAYTHQGWPSEDGRFLFVDDEADESRFNLTTTTHVIDIQDPAMPGYLGTFTNGRASIDHNLMVRGTFVYEANYTSGLRIFDVSHIEDVREIAYFDTHRASDERQFEGAWGVFTDFPSGIVVVSDIEEGLFVLEPCVHEAGTAGDFDGSGSADLRDFALLQRCFGPGPLPGTCLAADSNCDLQVWLDDFAVFASAQSSR